MFWSFDSNYNDLYNVYNGAGINSPTFSSPGYTGYGSAVSLTGSSSQYVLVNQYKDMTYTSFTWEVWIYPTSLSKFPIIFRYQYFLFTRGAGDNSIVGMCQSPAYSLCLQLMISNQAPRFSFYANDCNGTTIVTINQWHHLAFVYDYTIRSQYIYMNGILECSASSSGPFLATQGAITIGAVNSTGSGSASNFWTGRIDQLSYVSQAKSATEILDDATLVAYYSFDNGINYRDSGPNGINGVSR